MNGGERQRRRVAKVVLATAVAAALATVTAGVVPAHADDRRNVFDDPFIAITQGVAACPVPVGPAYTAEEARAEEHGRIQRGVSCYQAGRCRLPNAYLYDKEIIPRVAKAVLADGRYGNTSVWAMGQRRWVWLMGCVADAEQARALEALVRNIDDVEAVINQLMVGTQGPPPYDLPR